jgi:hypothetical protein
LPARNYERCRYTTNWYPWKDEANGSRASLTETWEHLGLISLGFGIARTFGFGNADVVSRDFDFHAHLALKPPPSSTPLRLDPYKATSTDVPPTLTNVLVLSATMQENPESEIEPLRELPLEGSRDTDGVVTAARIGYLTALVYTLDSWGKPDAVIDEANGTWLEAGTLALPMGHCIAVNPTQGSIKFDVKPGSYIAEVYEFTDADLGFFDCDFGVRIRWVKS